MIKWWTIYCKLSHLPILFKKCAGCHTVGIAHCVFFQDRLYPNTPLFDPNMDPSLRRELIPVCPKDTITNNFAFLDQNPESSNIVDNSFFIQILNQRGILEFDQVLGRDPTTIEFVQGLAANGTLFNDKLAQAMVKLQAVDVLTGDQGEIRNVCSRVNWYICFASPLKYCLTYFLIHLPYEIKFVISRD